MMEFSQPRPTNSPLPIEQPSPLPQPEESAVSEMILTMVLIGAALFLFAGK